MFAPRGGSGKSVSVMSVSGMSFSGMSVSGMSVSGMSSATAFGNGKPRKRRLSGNTFEERTLLFSMSS